MQVLFFIFWNWWRDCFCTFDGGWNGNIYEKSCTHFTINFIFASLSGIIVHSILGHPDFLQSGFLAIGFFFGGLVGAKLSLSVKEQNLKFLIYSSLIASAKLIFDSLTSGSISF